MKKLTLLFLLISAFIVEAQTIVGKVTHKNKPVENISVYVRDLQIGTVTDAYGKFTITSTKLKTNTSYELTVSGLGFVTKTLSVTTGTSVNISVEEDTENLQEVTVTGYKKSPTVNNSRVNSISQLPVLQKHQIPNVNGINLEVLQEQRITSLSEAVNLVPSFAFSESRGNTFVNVKVRGYNATQLYNGLRLESNVRSGEGNVNFNLIDNIEFINGSSGIKYGNASPGGAINVNSKQAKISNEGGALASYGSFNTFNVALDKNFVLNDKAGFRINGAYANGRRARIYTDFSNYGFTPSFVFKPSDKDEIRVDYSYFHDERTPDKGNLVLDPNQPITVDNLVNKSLTDSFIGFKQDYQNESTHIGTFNYNRELTDIWNLDMRLGIYNRDRESRILNSVRATTTDRNTGLYTSFTRASVAQEDASRTYASALNFIAKDLKTGSVLHNIQAGVDYWDNYNNITGYNADDRRNVFSTRDAGDAIDVIDYTNPIFTNNDISALTQEQQDAYYFKNLNARSESFKSIFGVVAQDQLVFFDKLRVTLGGRFSYGETYSTAIENFNQETETTTKNDTQYFTGWSYNGGVFYDINPKVTVFASYANTFDESSVSSTRVDINGDIIPNETVDQFEIGARTTLFNNLLSANVNLYYMINNDVAIQATDENGDPLISDNAMPQNPNGFYYLFAEAENRKGAEIFLQGNITPQWSLLGSYAFFEYELEPAEGEDFQYALINGQPKHSGSIWSKYNFDSGALKGLSFGAGAQIIGDRAIRAQGGQGINPSYTKFDAIIGYKFNKNFHLTAKFNNITNEVAFDSFRTLIVNPIQPFNFDIRLNYNF